MRHFASEDIAPSLSETGGERRLLVLLPLVAAVLLLFISTLSCIGGNRVPGPVFLHSPPSELAGDGSGSSPDGSSEQTLIVVGIEHEIQELPDVPFDEEPPQLPDNTEAFLNHPVVKGLEELGFELVNAFPEVWAGLFTLAPGWTVERAVEDLPKLFENIMYVEPDVELTGTSSGDEARVPSAEAAGSGSVGGSPQLEFGSIEDEDPPTEPWTDPSSGITYEIAADSVVIGLVKTLTEYPEIAFDQEPTATVPQPYGPELSVHPVFQSLISQGYVVLNEWPEVAAALVKLPHGVTVSWAIENLPQQYSDISYVEPDFVLPDYPQGRLTPNDSLFSDQWYFDDPVQDWDVDAPEGWYLETGSGRSSSIAIAVVDSGVARYNTDPDSRTVDHPDLSSRLHAYGGHAGRTAWEIKLGGGYPKPVLPYPPDWRHGTKVAGVIAAVTNNNQGIAGANCASQHRIFSVQYGTWTASKFQSCLNTAYSVVAKAAGIYSGRPQGVPVVPIKVLNLSIAHSSPSTVEAEIIHFHLSPAMVCSASAGNGLDQNGVATDVPHYPAAIHLILANPRKYPNYGGTDYVIGVGATTRSGYLQNSSNYGIYNVDVSAPGEEIRTTNMADCYTPTYTWSSGTSLSAPIVSGLASLVACEFPSLTPRDAYWRIINRRTKARNGPGYHFDPGKANYYNTLRP